MTHWRKLVAGRGHIPCVMCSPSLVHSEGRYPCISVDYILDKTVLKVRPKLSVLQECSLAKTET